MEAIFYVVAILGAVLLLLVARALFRAQLPPLPARLRAWLDLNHGPRKWTGLRELLGRLKTRPDIRYGLPWVLVIGEPGSGRAGVVRAMARGQHVRLLERDQERPLKNQVLNNRALKLHDRGMLLDLEASDRSGWRTALGELNNWRPERPLDSVVLMISAASLLDGDPTRLRTLARRLYFQLWSLQKELEFVLPVYLLVTGTDAVDGFRSFWNCQHQYREQMFGWSSPFTLETRFSPEWIDQALDQLQEQLYQLQSGVMGRGLAIDDADRFVLFPKRLNQLRDNLKKLSAVLFHETVYETGASVRGLYFCGSLADGADAAFLSDLVAHKIYPERNQARPLRKALLSRHRLTRRLQYFTHGAFAALFMSLAFTGWALHRDTASQLQALQHIQAMAGKSDAMRTSSTGDSPCLSQSQYFSLLRYIGEIRASEWRWNIPYSYPLFGAHGPAQLSARYVADKAIEGLVMPTLKCRLEERIRQLDLKLPQHLEPPLSQAAAIWSRAVSEIALLGQQRENFRWLSQPHTGRAGDREAGTATMAAFIALTEYLLEKSPADNYLLPDRALYHALLEVDFSEFSALAKPAGFDSRLTQALYTGTRDLRNLHLEKAERSAQILNALAGEQAAWREARDFREWYDYIEGHWLHTTPERNHCHELARTLAPAITLWPQAGAAIALLDSGNCYQPLLQRLSAVTWAGTPILLARDNGEITWSSEFLFELSALASLSSLPSMQVDTQGKLDCSTRRISLWNNRPVQVALSHLNEYQGYLRREHQLARERGHRDPDPLYTRVGNRQIQRLVHHLIAEALPEAEQAPDPQRQLAERSDAFNRTLESLLLLKNLYRQLLPANADDTWIGCVDLYAGQQLDTLQQLAGDSFRLHAGDHHAGGEARIFPALRDTPTAAAYFQNELDRVQWLADLAAPYSRWLGTPSGGIDNQPARFWSDTIAELRRLTVLKDIQGDAGQLSDFLNLQALPLTYGNCRQRLTALEADSARASLFAQRRMEILELARQACDNDTDALAQRSYLALHQRFNANLAGRFPFAGPEAPDAEIEKVREFFDYYAATAPQLEYWADEQNYWVRDFLYRMDAVAGLMRNLLVNGEPRPLNLSLGFRLDADNSPGSEQVIRWQFDNGRQQIFYPNGGEQIRWQPGEPVRLTLRWAQRSPFQPQPDSNQAGLSVSRNDASFRQDGDWALLRLIRLHRDSSRPVSSRLALSFAVPVAQAPEQNPERSIFKLGMAFQSLDAESQQWAPLPWPASFPSRAPAPHQEEQ